MSLILPSDPTDEELARDWLLSEQDLIEVRRCRSDDKRHSFAIQLCTLRAYGRFLGQDYDVVPTRIVNHVGRQLGMPPVLFVAPPARKQTDAEHERRIRDYLGFRTFDDAVRRELAAWLLARAAEGMLGDELIVRAERRLFSERVVVPARTTLERLVISVVSSTEAAIIDRIHDRIPEAHRNRIDILLRVVADTKRSGLESFREAPSETTPDAINRSLKLTSELRDMDLSAVDLSGLLGVSSSTVAHYAELARRYDVAHLRRFATSKARALVMCFLIEREKTLLDGHESQRSAPRRCLNHLNLPQTRGALVVGDDVRSRNFTSSYAYLEPLPLRVYIIFLIGFTIPWSSMSTVSSLGGSPGLLVR